MHQYFYGMRIYRGSPYGAMLSPDGRTSRRQVGESHAM